MTLKSDLAFSLSKIENNKNAESLGHRPLCSSRDEKRVQQDAKALD